MSQWLQPDTIPIYKHSTGSSKGERGRTADEQVIEADHPRCPVSEQRRTAPMQDTIDANYMLLTVDVAGHNASPYGVW